MVSLNQRLIKYYIINRPKAFFIFYNTANNSMCFHETLLFKSQSICIYTQMKTFLLFHSVASSRYKTRKKHDIAVHPLHSEKTIFCSRMISQQLKNDKYCGCLLYRTLHVLESSCKLRCMKCLSVIT